MGCNCSKGGKKPHGSEPKQSQQSIQREGAAKQSFELRTADGKTQSFARKLDAHAAQVRSGGTLRPF